MKTWGARLTQRMLRRCIDADSGGPPQWFKVTLKIDCSL
jgi:hypothetical protein